MKKEASQIKAEKREIKKRKRPIMSGKSVFKLKDIIIKKPKGKK